MMLFHARLAALALLASCGSAASCADVGSAQPTTGAEAFDADRAWAHLVAQVEIGPRPPGSEGAEENRVYIETHLRAAGLEPVRERFTAVTPAGAIAMCNVWAELPATGPTDGAEPPILYLGAHYDTKRLPFRFVGANDGASGVAVVLELARVLAQREERPVTWRFIFFDGEEALRKDWEDPDNRYGSRRHVDGIKSRGELPRVKALVLLDLVGDKDLVLENDSFSDRRLLEAFFDAARENGMVRHLSRRPEPMYDDHLSFLEAGIEAVDLIDLDYGPYNSWWHTAEDTIDKCSKDSLAAVGRIVLLGLPTVEGFYAP